MARIKKNDIVKIIAGKHKGSTVASKTFTSLCHWLRLPWWWTKKPRLPAGLATPRIAMALLYALLAN